VKSEKLYVSSLTGATLLFGVSLILGCSGTHTTQQHPDEIDSINRALITNGFVNVNVSQDRTKGVITLTGTVQSQERKTYAEQIARVSASDYVIANEIGVTPPPPTVAELIEDKYKAMLQANKNLDLKDLNYQAKDGILILSGTVRTAHERTEAVTLAKGVPKVQRVVDEIKVTRKSE
jgi:hyperosmotically inducible periplasmic protein